MVKIEATRDDEVKQAILECLHEKRFSPRSVDSAKVGIMELRKALKQKGMEYQEVIRNLLFLVEARWVNELVEENQIKTERGSFSTKIKKYIQIRSKKIESRLRT